MQAQHVVILLGGDLGDPLAALEHAERAIAGDIGQVLARSRDHWTEPWGFRSTTLFLNRALLVSTELPLPVVLERSLAIEQRLGRVRSVASTPTSRVIDIDILAAGNAVIDTHRLVVPHPRLPMRRFALAPLCDIAPGWLHPTLQRTALDLLNSVPG